MSDTKSQSEPTMEEILASIRRIISEDEPERAPAAEETPDARPETIADDEPYSPVEDEDVLELTDVAEEVPEPPEPARPVPEPEPEPEPEPYRAPPMQEPEVQMDAYSKPDQSGSDDIDRELDRLISDTPAGMAASALAGLSHAVSQSRGLPIGASDRTLEDIVKELIRPMLREWLDANLPRLVERLVQKEIARIAGDSDRR